MAVGEIPSSGAATGKEAAWQAKILEMGHHWSSSTGAVRESGGGSSIRPTTSQPDRTIRTIVVERKGQSFAPSPAAAAFPWFPHPPSHYLISGPSGRRGGHWLCPQQPHGTEIRARPEEEALLEAQLLYPRATQPLPT
jgi:hypothetical protein